MDNLLAEFNSAHDADVVATLISGGLDLSVNADSRRAAIKANKKKMFSVIWMMYLNLQ